MWEYGYSSELYHHGIKGQRWGVRRYQNADGSLTEAGKKRYGRMDGSLNDAGKKLISKQVSQSLDDGLKALDKYIKSKQRDIDAEIIDWLLDTGTDRLEIAYYDSDKLITSQEYWDDLGYMYDQKKNSTILAESGKFINNNDSFNRVKRLRDTYKLSNDNEDIAAYNEMISMCKNASDQNLTIELPKSKERISIA